MNIVSIKKSQIQILAALSIAAFLLVSIFSPLVSFAQISGNSEDPYGVNSWEGSDEDGNTVSYEGYNPLSTEGDSVNSIGTFFNNFFNFDSDGNAVATQPVTPPSQNSGSSVNTANSGSCSTTYQPGSGIAGLITVATCVLGMVIPLLIIAAIIVFLYGIVMYIKDADNKEKRKEGSQFMLYGIIALFVMVSMWALVGVLGNTFGIDTTTIPQLPT